MKSTYNSPFIQDADLRLEGSLPNVAGGTVLLAYLDLEILVAPNSGTRAYEGSVDCWLDGVPPSVASDDTFFTLSIETADNTAFATTLLLATGTFTASGGAGIAENHVRSSLPSDCPRYIRFRATSSVGMADASTYVFAGALICPILR